MNIMTRDEVMKLRDRELDAAIAEHVMGWKRVLPTHPSNGTVWALDGKVIKTQYTWKPSENIADAWRVVEKMIEDGYFVEVFAHECCAIGIEIDDEEFAEPAYHSGKDDCENISRAALLSVLT